MKHCTKIIKHSARERGIVGSSICTKPIFCDDLCKHHYIRKQEKLVNWIDRPDYRQATQDDLDKMRSLKLSNTHTHRLYQCIKGEICEYSKLANKYLPCGIPADYKLFCVLNFN
jgi:hypothetical protein